mgnify:CR=1 FL=1
MSPSPPTEIEVKFELAGAEAGDALAEAPALADDLALGPVAEQVDHDDYADGEALPLLRAGWALRHRTRFATGDDGWPVVRHRVTLKQLAEAAARDGVQKRVELEGPVAGEPFDPAAWPEAVREAAAAACGGALPPLAELFTLVQRRRVRSVSRRGAPIGELSIDAVRLHLPGDVRRGADAIARFDEVEFELAPGGSLDDLGAAAAALGAACGGRAAHGGKVDRAVALLAHAPAVAALPDAQRQRLAAALAVLGARPGAEAAGGPR